MCLTRLENIEDKIFIDKAFSGHKHALGNQNEETEAGNREVGQQKVPYALKW